MPPFLKRFVRKPSVQRGIAWLAARYLTFVFRTTRWRRVGWDVPDSYIASGKGFITCFWHNRLLMGCFGWYQRKKSFHMLISSHADGKLITRIVAYHGIKTIAGSTNHGGTQALRSMIKALKEGHTVGITPDGPRGPCYSVSEGVLAIAKLAKVDILPFTYSKRPCLILNTWDKFRLALPFGRGILMWGRPFQLDSTKPLDQQRQDLRKVMLELSQEADQAIGYQNDRNPQSVS